MANSILVTGASGVIGQALLPHLARRSDVATIFALTRGPLPTPAFQVPSVLTDKIIWLRGDITAGCEIGLDAATSERVRRETSVIIHGAADVRFSAPRDEAWRTNVAGTENVLAFAVRCRRLERFAFLSTTYIAGRRTGTISEASLEHHCGFTNPYEESKYEAERRVRALGSGFPACLLRLSTVLGDSHSGEVARVAAVHQALRFYYHSLTPMIPGTPQSLVDMIPLDYAAAAAAKLTFGPFHAGQAFHICGGSDSLSLAELLDLTLESFIRLRPAWRKRAIEKPAIVDLNTFQLFVRSVEEVGDEGLRNSVSVLKHFAPQLAFPKQFDDRSAMAALAAEGVERPRVRDYFPQVVGWLIEAGWAGKRQAMVEAAC